MLSPSSRFSGSEPGILVHTTDAIVKSDRNYRGGINGGSSRGNSRRSSCARRKPCWTGTPEIYFAKPIDNSRLVKVEDPRRGREMRQFGVALKLPFSAGHDLHVAAFQGH